MKTLTPTARFTLGVHICRVLHSSGAVAVAEGLQQSKGELKKNHQIMKMLGIGGKVGKDGGKGGGGDSGANRRGGGEKGGKGGYTGGGKGGASP